MSGKEIKQAPKKKTASQLEATAVVATPNENKKAKSASSHMGAKMTFESIKAIVFAMIIGVLFMAVLTPESIGAFFENFWTMSFGGIFQGDFVAVSNTLANLSYMIPLGLALAVSFKIKIFNIGSAGQFLAGGFIAFFFATKLDFAGSWIVVLLIGTVVGGLIGWLIAILKNRFGINEVISSIMLNWVIFYLIRSASPGNSESWTSIYGSITDTSSLKKDWILNLFGTSSILSHINTGIIIAIALVIVFALLYKKTNWGFKQEILGGNVNVSNYLGLDGKHEINKTMAISGALAGLAGAIYWVGFSDSTDLIGFMNGGITDIPGLTFNGITIALLGFNSAIGVMFASILLSMLNPAVVGSSLDAVAGDMHIVDIIQGSMIVLLTRSHYILFYKDAKAKKEKKVKEVIEEEKTAEAKEAVKQ